MRGPNPVDDPDLGYGWNDNDPFKDPYPEREYVIMGDENEKYGSTVYYVDYGTHFELHSMNAGIKEDDFWSMKKKQAENELVSDLEGMSKARYNPWDRILPSQEHNWLQNHYFDHHEIFQCLFLTGGLVRTGPEQIWIKCHYDQGCGENTGSVGPGQREAVSSFELSAGSINLGFTDDYCYQGIKVGGQQQLAIQVPGLWKWPCISLGKYEFFNTSEASPETKQPWQSIVTRSIHPDPSLPGGLYNLQCWFRECKNKHFHCDANISAYLSRPRRLVSVRSSDGSLDPRLYIPSDDENVPYTTLSYQPGPSPEYNGGLQLLSSNLGSLQDRIPVHMLAQFFRDAILITRALSIDYIWIDALCIIQDSPQDRANEDSKKLQYYANSELNIAATASANSQHGILHPRDIVLHSARLTGNAVDVGIRPLAEDVFSLIRECRYFSKRPPITNKPLGEQSHAFLERISAKRTVHFTEQQMIWQCKTCLVGEDGQIGEDRDRFSQLCGKSPFDFHLGPRMREITGPNENEHHRYPDMTMTRPIEGHTGVKYSLDEALMDTNWYSFLGEYTKHSVHDSSLLLPLLSPFAKTIEKETPAIYLAGLWAMDDQIPFRSLLWYCETKGTPADNGSPSWAWSSVVGAITHPAQEMYRMDHPGAQSEWLPRNAQRQRHVLNYPHKDSQIRILAVTTRLSTSDVFGRVEGGGLRITGLVHSYTGAGTWEFAAERHSFRQSESMDRVDDFVTGSRKTFFIDGHDKDEGQTELVKDTVEEEKQFKIIEHLDTISPDDIEWNAEKHLLLLVAEFRDQLDSSRKPHITPNDSIQFIILERRASEKGNNSCYVRIGTAHLQRKNRDWGIMSGSGLWGVHSAYTEENGWKREELVLV